MTAAERMKQYEDLFAQSQAYNPAKFQEDFEKSYGEATNYNKDLYDERANVIGQAQALPNQLREQYYSSAIRNPLAQESLISTRRGNLTSDITSLTDFLGARGARYQDVLGKHLAGYQTSAEQARMAAENAWRMYQDALAQEEAAKARRAAAAAASSQNDLWSRLFSQGGQQGGGQQGGGQEDIVIEVPGKQSWTDTAYKALATPIGGNQTGITTSPFTTFTNLIGNFLGNQQVAKRSNMSLLDKILNR